MAKLGGRTMNVRERDIVRYALGYLATGDGRKARSHTATNLSPETTREIRKIARKMRPAVFARARAVVKK
jgi:hypothetical protein